MDLAEVVPQQAPPAEGASGGLTAEQALTIQKMLRDLHQKVDGMGAIITRVERAHGLVPRGQEA